jgi:hypothetical protein
MLGNFPIATIQIIPHNLHERYQNIVEEEKNQL